jgi:cell division protein FtsB
MEKTRSLPGLMIPIALMLIGAYFTFVAVQGDYGLFYRIQVEAEIDTLHADLNLLRAEADRMAVLTHRLSDNYLDLDLLDEQTRAILGYMRADEIIID